MQKRVPQRTNYVDSAFASLVSLHWKCALLQTGNAIAQTVLTATTFSYATLPLYDTIPGFRGPNWTLMVEKIGDVQLGVFSVIFLWLSALQHFSVWWAREWYATSVQEMRNPLRWLEYTFSASAMKVMIAMLSGVMIRDILIPVIALTMATMMCGYLSDRDPSEGRFSTSMRTFWFGTVFWLASWEPILTHFLSGAYRNGAPDWVYAIVFILLGLDASFASLQFWWLLPRTPKSVSNYVFVEKGYCVLSLTSKVFLAWFTYIGTTRL